MVTDCHSILARWRSHFSQLWNVHEVNDVRQTEIRTAEPLVPEQSAFWFEMAIGKQKRHESTGIDRMPADMIKEGGRTILSRIHKLFNYIQNKEESPEEGVDHFTYLRGLEL